MDTSLLSVLEKPRKKNVLTVKNKFNDNNNTTNCLVYINSKFQIETMVLAELTKLTC